MSVRKIATNLIVLFILVVGIISLSGCSGGNFDGHYTGTLYDETIVVDIEGDVVALGYDYDISVGTVDKDAKVLHLSSEKDDKKPHDYPYDFVNGNLVLTVYGDTVNMKKDDNIQRISSLSGSYNVLNPEYYVSLDIRDEDALFTSDGIGTVYELDGNSLVDKKRNDTYNINTVYGALIVSDKKYYRYAFYKDSTNSEIKDIAEKYRVKSEYDDDEDDIEKLEIDTSNNKVILTMYGDDLIGEIDPSQRKLYFKQYDWEYGYDIYYNKLVLIEDKSNTHLVFIAE